MLTPSAAGSLAAVLLAALALPGCSSINPLCGSSRPTPVLTSIDPDSVTFAQVQDTFTLNLAGSHFVGASVVEVNNVEVATDVTSATTIKATVGPATLSAPGTFDVWVHTPAGNSSNLGCDSGGNSSKTPLTVE